MSIAYNDTVIAEAARELVEVCAGAFVEEAVSFTCREADAIVAFLIAADANTDAASFLKAHARGETPGDKHAGL